MAWYLVKPRDNFTFYEHYQKLKLLHNWLLWRMFVT